MKEETRHSWKLLAQPLVLMVEGLTLDSPLQVSSEAFQVCCPQRSEDTEIFFVYKLELKSWSSWNLWHTSQRLQSGLDSTLTDSFRIHNGSSMGTPCRPEAGVIPDFANIGCFILLYLSAHTCKGRIAFTLTVLTRGKWVIFTCTIITEETLSLCCSYKVQ